MRSSVHCPTIAIVCPATYPAACALPIFSAVLSRAICCVSCAPAGLRPPQPLQPQLFQYQAAQTASQVALSPNTNPAPQRGSRPIGGEESEPAMIRGYWTGNTEVSRVQKPASIRYISIAGHALHERALGKDLPMGHVLRSDQEFGRFEPM